nr:putative disease resistance protein [Quercus suber]
MAGALVGGAFLSAFLQVLFDRIASSEVADFFRGRILSDGLLRKLKIALLSVNAVLEDAEEKQVTKSAVKEWLDELKDAVYDAEDILDEIASKALQRKLDAEFLTSGCKAQSFISASLNPFAKEIEPKIQEVLDRLEYLARQKDVIGLREVVGGKPSERLPTTSLVEESDICAKFVSGQFSFRLEGDYSHELVNKTRHLSYFKTRFDSSKKFEDLYKAKRLRTFLSLTLPRSSETFYLTKKLTHDLLPMLRCLRVLSLSHYSNMTDLPDSIGKIKHLRYLNLSFTAVKRLPDSICKLCNLQTLKLLGCRCLAVLPKDMWRLINLRHLDISETSLKEMPIQLGRLKCLHTLTTFIISKHSGSCIGELGKLSSLRGMLSILELQNVASPTDALNAGLKDKRYLEELVLEWSADT